MGRIDNIIASLTPKEYPDDIPFPALAQKLGETRIEYAARLLEFSKPFLRVNLNKPKEFDLQ